MAGEMEGGSDGLVDLLGSPAAGQGSAMQQDLQDADDAWIMALDAGIAHLTDSNGEGNPLQERKIDVDVEPLRLETGERTGNDLELLADGVEVIEAFLEAGILEIVRDQLVT